MTTRGRGAVAGIRRGARRTAATAAALVKAESAVRWLSRLGLPARLVTQEGTVVTTPGWPFPTPTADPTPAAEPTA